MSTQFTRPDAMLINLSVLADAFAVLARHNGWDTQPGAWFMCGEAARGFAFFLRSFEVRCRRVGLTGLPPFVAALRDFPEGELEYHLVVLVDDTLCFDWTRRQYQPDAPFPYIATRKQLEAEGWTLTEVFDESEAGK